MSEIITPRSFNHFLSVSSIDGRFRGNIEEVSTYFSEYATYKNRVFVEIEYLIAFLASVKKPLDIKKQNVLRNIHKNFSLEDCNTIWEKDVEINHDTKSVEYFLIKKFTEKKITHLINYIHIGLTTNDIDSTGLAISIRDFCKILYIPSIKSLAKRIKSISIEQKDLIMLSRTHGQFAVPTTVGKELANFYKRLKVQIDKLERLHFGAGITGSVGNHNALVYAYPAINWTRFSEDFLKKLNLDSYPMKTQVEPYDYKVEFLQSIKRINLVISALDEDIWRYLAAGYLILRDSKGHVGSSTMPQKVNPIGFELSESYTLLSNGILDVLERKLPINRWQRDLTDKYLLRDLGQSLAMSLLSCKSTEEALKQIGFNSGIINKDLDEHWETISEGIQTLLRTTSYKQPYEKVRELTRGKIVTKEIYNKFIDEINVSENIKEKLKKLSPRTYIGYSNKFEKLIK
ncbi:MAG: hypothetical protein ACD_24C00090G0002 [uncultured bacterium]|nr:MAG: hypothetical protein ACD_24C00090G0002 [uncultured bacterium]